jgi:hypothetical protein
MATVKTDMAQDFKLKTYSQSTNTSKQGNKYQYDFGIYNCLLIVSPSMSMSLNAKHCI